MCNYGIDENVDKRRGFHIHTKQILAASIESIRIRLYWVLRGGFSLVKAVYFNPVMVNKVMPMIFEF